jgi:hypothetical protein
MRIEYHNAHGEQLILSLTPREATWMVSKITTALDMTLDTEISHYATFKTEFENDNNRWVPTEFNVLIEGDAFATRHGCLPAFPCGKPVTDHPFCPQGPCTREAEHDGFCYVQA